MLAFREPVSGAVQISATADGYDGWEALPAPPGPGWRWHQAGLIWVRAPEPMLPERLWQLLTLEQHAAVRVLAAQVPLMAVAMDRINARREPLPLDDGNFVAFVITAVGGGALTEAEGARVLAGLPPG